MSRSSSKVWSMCTVFWKCRSPCDGKSDCGEGGGSSSVGFYQGMGLSQTKPIPPQNTIVWYISFSRIAFLGWAPQPTNDNYFLYSKFFSGSFFLNSTIQNEWITQWILCISKIPQRCHVFFFRDLTFRWSLPFSVTGKIIFYSGTLFWWCIFPTTDSFNGDNSEGGVCKLHSSTFCTIQNPKNSHPCIVKNCEKVACLSDFFWLIARANCSTARVGRWVLDFWTNFKLTLHNEI